MTQIHPSLFERKIIHVDMDAFYASIEMLDDPSLVGKPLVVGGRPDSRGVVCTASYEARKFGVRSAMSCAKAARLCPQAIFVKPRFGRYVEISQQIRAIMGRYATQLEPLSLDEAYLDVTGNTLGLYATQIAARIRAEIHGECGLTASAGVAPNKMLAKIASDLNKPDGLSVIRPSDVASFVRTLPLARIHGIGPVSARKLAGHGLVTCADVSARSADEITELLGANYGTWLYRRAQGLDDRQVETERTRKSFGQETTFAHDVFDAELMRKTLRELALGVGDSLQEAGVRGRTVTVKVRYPDFTTVTRATTLALPTDAPETLAGAAVELLLRTAAAERGVRLLGVALSKLTTPVALGEHSGQLTLFGD